jgi:hypothetical protein
MQMMIKRNKPVQQEDSVTLGGGSAVVDIETVNASKLGMKQGQLAPAGILVQKLQMPEPQRMADQPAMAAKAPDAIIVAELDAAPSKPPAAAPRKKQVAQVEDNMPESKQKQVRKLKY